MASISPVFSFSPLTPIICRIWRGYQSSISHPLRSGAIGPPSAASGDTWPMAGPLKRRKRPVGDERNALRQLFIGGSSLRGVEHLRHTASLRAFIADDDGHLLAVWFWSDTAAMASSSQSKRFCPFEHGLEHFFWNGGMLHLPHPRAPDCREGLLWCRCPQWDFEASDDVGAFPTFARYSSHFIVNRFSF